MLKIIVLCTGENCFEDGKRLSKFECSVKNLKLNPDLVYTGDDVYKENGELHDKFKIATTIANKDFDESKTINDWIGEEMNEPGQPYQNANF